MKTIPPRTSAGLFVRAFLALLCLLACAGARAELIAYESFNTYSPGPLNGKDGGVGWFVPWAAVSGIDVVAAPGAPSLAKQIAPSGPTIGGGNALRLGASHNNAFNRLFSPRFKGKDVYISFVFQARHTSQTGNIPANTNVFAGWQIMDDDPNHDIDTIGVIGASSPGGARIGARVGGSSGTPSSAPTWPMAPAISSSSNTATGTTPPPATVTPASG